ncbi:MAG: DUF434 domain-containing protein [Sulfolobales archaeon]
MVGFLRDELIKALEDYKYLLTRGYNQKPSLDLVTSRYRLSKPERMLLFRCIHSDSDVVEVYNKTVTPSQICSQRLVIDGFNTLLTITSVLEGDYVYLCDDGFVRDLRSSKIKDFEIEGIKASATTLMRYLKLLKPSDTVLILDKQVSKSGELKNGLSEILTNIKVLLASKADITVLTEEGVISSSDFLILKKASKVFDMAGYIIMNEFRHRIIDLNKILRDR